MTLTVDGVFKHFGRYRALSGVSLEARDGEFLALLGPSGSGKTTLLRVLAGLERPDSGGVFVDGTDFLGLSARERRVGLVFQQYALFRHMTVARNIAFGLEVRPARSRPSRAAIGARVEELLALARIEGLGGRYPAQLSGGQRQRVAVARALAVEPRLLLLDEPFGALDTKVRKELRAELRRIHDATGVTTVLVTHDQEEAMALADRVALMNRGRIEQIGAPHELDETPATPFVFEFLGECNRLPCVVGGGVARFEGFAAPVIGGEGRAGQGVALFRPSDTHLAGGPVGEGLPVRVVEARGRGAVRAVECQALGGHRLTAELPEHLAIHFQPGQRVRLTARRAMVDFAPGAAGGVETPAPARERA
ncbi:MAG: sulfate/molybdate ABC transporter ATP-binding protein [Caulobacteraceae bacterium]